METLTIHISGMACGGCADTLAQALQALDGVIEAEVSHSEARAAVGYDPARVSSAQIRAAVEAAGYSVC